MLEKARDQEVVGIHHKSRVLATTRVAKRPSCPVRNTQHKMRDLDVQVRYAMTWDDKVAPMSVNILREFMRSLCSAEEHLPKSFSGAVCHLRSDLSHDRVATWLHRVPSNGSSSDARRLLNIDRLRSRVAHLATLPAGLSVVIRVASRAAAAAQLV